MRNAYYICLFLLLPVVGVADTGSAEYQVLRGLLEGNLAVVFSVVAALFGLYQWLIQQQTWGLIVLLIAVVFTALPSIFDGLCGGMQGFLAATGVTLQCGG